MVDLLNIDAQLAGYNTVYLPDQYKTINDVINGLATLYISDDTDKQGSPALEELLGKLKLSLDYLITHIIKFMAKLKSSMAETTATMLQDATSILTRWEEKLDEMNEIDDDLFNDHMVDSALSKEAYTLSVTIPIDILTTPADLYADIRSSDADIQSEGIGLHMDKLKELGIAVTSSDMSPSGYDTYTTAEYDDLAKTNRSLSGLGYTKYDLNVFIDNTKKLIEYLKTNAYIKHLTTMENAYRDICTEIDDIRKSNDAIRNGARLEELTVQICRVYQYGAVYELTVSCLIWRPYLTAIQILTSLEKIKAE